MNGIGPVWIEVDLDRIAANIRAIRAVIGERRLMAVVKADGYGHGATEVARVAVANGASHLAVTTIAEGLELRAAGISAPILVLGGILPDEADTAVGAALTVNVYSMASAAALSQAAVQAQTRVTIHVEVDTGMSRSGVTPASAVEFVVQCRELPGVDVEGIFTQFVSAFREDRRMTERQLNRFEHVITELATRGIDIPIKHAANSEAILTHPDTWLDLVRVGNMMYGLRSAEAPTSGGPAVESSWAMKARILSVQNVPAGTTVGYGPDYVARRPITVATVPVGYVDGAGLEPASRYERLRTLIRLAAILCSRPFSRIHGALSLTSGLFRLNGERLTILGRMTMQQTMLDVTGYDVHVGDTVTVQLRRTVVNPRLPKVYLVNGQPVRARTVAGEIVFRNPATSEEAVSKTTR